jgi:hypothetical protein
MKIDLSLKGKLTFIELKQFPVRLVSKRERERERESPTFERETTATTTHVFAALFVFSAFAVCSYRVVSIPFDRLTRILTTREVQ